jgi:hypothetical protein
LYFISDGTYRDRVFRNVPVRLLRTRFTNAISCFEPGPQEHYRDIFIETPCRIRLPTIYTLLFYFQATEI